MAPTIRAIADSSVHHIQSGQVIVDLQSVVKELVENSLDAGATSIHVRFKNQGLDSIEVQDNGRGIAPHDFHTVALKHYTSKLSDYDHLTSLQTFGFRGEALSSLCAVSSFHLLTARREDGAVGTKLHFDLSGELKATSPAAAQPGTTAAVENLFDTLPVRRKELEKNIKREYAKVVSLLYAYACICVGVRFAVTNHMPKANKLVSVCSTNSNPTTKENIANVFGAKTLLALIPLDVTLDMSPSRGPSAQSARDGSIQAPQRSSEVQLQGHISKPTFGQGRQAPDRQMFFVNSRPCLLPQVAKAINEVYKSFNTSQSPFIFANLVMDTNAYDVNVSPDKRTIMLHDQTALVETLKAALTELFEKTDHTVPQSTLPTRKLPAYQPLTVTRKRSTLSQTPSHGQDEDPSDADDAWSGEEEEAVARSASAIPVSTPSGLIHNWLGRDTEPRNEKQFSKMQSVGLSKGKQKLVEKLRDKPQVPAIKADVSIRGAQEPNSKIPERDVPDDVEEESPPSPASRGGVVESRIDAVINPDPLSTPYGDLFSQPPLALTRQAHDFNAQIERVRRDYEKAKTLEQVQTRSERPFFEPEMATKDDQQNPAPQHNNPHTAIPAITPASQKEAVGPVQYAFDKMRPKRTPQQIAQITVGQVTTTTVIGRSPPSKKRRIHKPDDSQAVSKFGASPLLARGLRKNFAAPGSQLEADINSGATSQIPIKSRNVEQSSQSDDEDEHEAVEGVLTPATSIRSRKPSADHVELPTSDALDELLPALANDDEWDEEYLDEEEKKVREDERIARLIQEAEDVAARPTGENLKRANNILKYGVKRKDATLRLARFVQTTSANIEQQIALFGQSCHPPPGPSAGNEGNVIKDELDDTEAESRLSLTVTKADFQRMVVLGQFNLGFILALRPAAESGGEDDIFIIDQHAADEKYNYERLQRTVTLQSQRLVRPLPLELTAVQEELLLAHLDALRANGFEVETTSYVTDADEEIAPGRRCRLLTLPMSKEKTFDLSDLEELLHLLSEQPSGSSFIPRPKKVQRMLAMRACRSSIMVGKTLTFKQMGKVVRHMGEMEKPWNCPHGRPTMRHLAALTEWRGWQEGDMIDEYQLDACSTHTQQGRSTDWAVWLKRRAK